MDWFPQNRINQLVAEIQDRDSSLYADLPAWNVPYYIPTEVDSIVPPLVHVLVQHVSAEEAHRERIAHSERLRKVAKSESPNAKIAEQELEHFEQQRMFVYGLAQQVMLPSFKRNGKKVSSSTAFVRNFTVLSLFNLFQSKGLTGQKMWEAIRRFLEIASPKDSIPSIKSLRMSLKRAREVLDNDSDPLHKLRESLDQVVPSDHLDKTAATVYEVMKSRADERNYYWPKIGGPLSRLPDWDDGSGPVVSGSDEKEKSKQDFMLIDIRESVGSEIDDEILIYALSEVLIWLRRTLQIHEFIYPTHLKLAEVQGTSNEIHRKLIEEYNQETVHLPWVKIPVPTAKLCPLDGSIRRVTCIAAAWVFYLFDLKSQLKYETRGTIMAQLSIFRNRNISAKSCLTYAKDGRNFFRELRYPTP